jgi:hypothetical protein
MACHATNLGRNQPLFPGKYIHTSRFGKNMGTKSILIGPTREKNGNQVIAYGFTYSELRDLDEALDELISYYEDMLSDNDVESSNFKEEVLGRIGSLQMKVDMYRGRALRNLEDRS